MKRLLDMLTYCRPHGGFGEARFIDTFIMPYGPTPFVDSNKQVLAYVVDVADRMSVVPPILFSSHTDTVHAQDDQTQTPIYDPDCGMVYKDDKRPLGADDAAGVWLMLEMIDAGVPGSYIFHRGEERGGIGSQGMAQCHKEWLKRFRWAIALDRKSTGSIITEQMCGTCCSDDFALAFATLLNDAEPGFAYAPDNTGMFTDTANYVGLIPECTNISVGYYDEHTERETLDVWHLEKLRDALITVFGGEYTLPVARNPEEELSRWFDEPYSADEIVAMSDHALEKYVRGAHPGDVADLLRSLAEEIYFNSLNFQGEDHEQALHA